MGIDHHVIKLTPEQRDDLVALYQAGASLMELAKAYSVGYRTVRHHLLRRGVTLRPPHVIYR